MAHSFIKRSVIFHQVMELRWRVYLAWILSNTHLLRNELGTANNSVGLPRWCNAFPDGSGRKSVCLQCRRPGFDPWVGKIPWRSKWQPTPVLLLGKSHGQRSLAGYIVHGVTKSWTLLRDSTTTTKLKIKWCANTFSCSSSYTKLKDIERRVIK